MASTDRMELLQMQLMPPRNDRHVPSIHSDVAKYLLEPRNRVVLFDLSLAGMQLKKVGEQLDVIEHKSKYFGPAIRAEAVKLYKAFTDDRMQKFAIFQERIETLTAIGFLNTLGAQAPSNEVYESVWEKGFGIVFPPYASTALEKRRFLLGEYYWADMGVHPTEQAHKSRATELDAQAEGLGARYLRDCIMYQYVHVHGADTEADPRPDLPRTCQLFDPIWRTKALDSLSDWIAQGMHQDLRRAAAIEAGLKPRPPAVDYAPLATQGYLVLPFLREDEIQPRREEFLRMCRSFPEFQDSKDEFEFVQGGFAALANPASFHHPFVREMRGRAFATHCAIFKGTGKYGHALFDRIMLRPKGAKPTAEVWHRDVTPNLAKEDRMFGGWVNFDSFPQQFSCVPMSHTDPKDNNDPSGFAPITNEAQKNRCQVEKQIVDIPPGHMIIFHQNIIHEVLSKAKTHNQYRLFTPFRLTPGTNQIFAANATAIENQGVPFIPSGQFPPMYPKLHWVNHREKLERFSLKLKDNACEMKQVKKYPDSAPLRVCYREMPSLRELGLPMYSRYTQEERDIFVPTRL